MMSGISRVRSLAIWSLRNSLRFFSRRSCSWFLGRVAGEAVDQRHRGRGARSREHEGASGSAPFPHRSKGSPSPVKNFMPFAASYPYTWRAKSPLMRRNDHDVTDSVRRPIPPRWAPRWSASPGACSTARACPSWSAPSATPRRCTPAPTPNTAPATPAITTSSTCST